MQHFMRGSMAGLSVLVGRTETPEVVACLHKCKENLEAPPMELLQPGMEILNNNGPPCHPLRRSGTSTTLTSLVILFFGRPHRVDVGGREQDQLGAAVAPRGLRQRPRPAHSGPASGAPSSSSFFFFSFHQH